MKRYKWTPGYRKTVTKIANHTAGKFVPTIISATGKEMDTRETENIFKKVTRWRRQAE